MLPLFINYLFTFLCLYLVYFAISSETHRNNIYIIYMCGISIIGSFVVSIIPTSFHFLRIPLLLVLVMYSIIIYPKQNIRYAINTTLICFGISLATYFISVLTVATFFLLIVPRYLKKTSCISNILVGIVQVILVIYISRNKRFKSGILQIINKTKSLIYILVTIFICFFLTNISFYKHSFTFFVQTLIVIVFFSFSLLLLYYWRYRIKQTYIENMHRLETLTFENTIADRDKQIKTLEDNNAYLGRIIHKYRKTIPAMELSVMELLQNCENFTPEELKAKAESLQTQLVELQEERDNLLDKYQKEASITTHTGLHTVDAMFALMEKRAKHEWIRYKTQINPNIRELALNSIKEADLLHLLGDLTENAFHAVSLGDNKDILIHFGKLNDCFLLEISDSGSAFDIQTYQNFGIEPSTSHKEDGGSGTGLMDIWKIKKEYKASLYIYEYENKDNGNHYTKKISFLFDGKNHFLLKTYRDQEVKKALIRGDLHVFPHSSS